MKPSSSGVKSARRAGRPAGLSGDLALLEVDAPTAVIVLPY
jgi:hypothetical protein